MIGVIYARYSSDSQREESIDGQLRECYAFAEREGISIFDTYIDRALSAKTDNRPQFQKPTITKEGLMLWLKQIQTMSLETKEHKQRLIDCFVNAVYLYDDKLVITFNYKEASKTVTLKEVNGSIIECSGAPDKAENGSFSALLFAFRRKIVFCRITA